MYIRLIFKCYDFFSQVLCELKAQTSFWGDFQGQGFLGDFQGQEGVCIMLELCNTNDSM